MDFEACRRRKVAVSHVGNYGENTMAEHTFALILALCQPGIFPRTGGRIFPSRHP
ncbi:MAG: hypothetical protein WCQ57_15265 [Verrucomicrobiota bacterium]